MNTITQHDKYMYSIKINGNYTKMLNQMFQIVIPQSFHDNTTNTIFFNAENVQSLSTYLQMYNHKMPYNKCIELIDYLSKQMHYLKKNGYGYYGFDIDDIIVIDNSYIIVCTTHLFQLINNSFIFYCPFKMPRFSSPELRDIQVLPTEISYNACYYSLGVLILFCLLNNKFSSNVEFENILSPLYNTKIYWFLKRCCEPISNKRILLLI
jgi:hypothetical protein